MEKVDFLHFCKSNVTTDNHELSAKVLPAAREYLLRHHKGKLPVIWLETSDSGDNNIALMNTTYPYLNQVFSDMIDLFYKYNVPWVRIHNAWTEH